MTHPQAQASVVRWACIALGWQWAWTYRSESVPLTGHESRAAAAND